METNLIQIEVGLNILDFNVVFIN